MNDEIFDIPVKLGLAGPIIGHGRFKPNGIMEISLKSGGEYEETVMNAIRDDFLSVSFQSENKAVILLSETISNTNEQESEGHE